MGEGIGFGAHRTGLCGVSTCIGSGAGTPGLGGDGVGFQGQRTGLMGCSTFMFIGSGGRRGRGRVQEHRTGFRGRVSTWVASSSSLHTPLA